MSEDKALAERRALGCTNGLELLFACVRVSPGSKTHALCGSSHLENASGGSLTRTGLILILGESASGEPALCTTHHCKVWWAHLVLHACTYSPLAFKVRTMAPAGIGGDTQARNV